MPRTITDQPGVARYPSPRLWKDCRHGLLNDLGLGFYQHAEFNGGFQSSTLTASANAPTLPDPTDAPASVDALRDDLTSGWEVFVEQVFGYFGAPVVLTALTNSLADDATGLALLIVDIEVQMAEIAAAFLLIGEVFTHTTFTGITTADLVREHYVGTVNAEIEAAFTNVIVNDEQSMAAFEMDFDDDTVLTAKSGDLGGVIDIETDADDNDAFSMFLRPFGEIERRSGKKMWFEVSVELGALADQAVFFGWAEEDALSRDVIADDCAALIGESYCGFRVLSGDTDGMDAAYKLGQAHMDTD